MAYVTEMTMDLKTFLRESTQSHAREEILNHKLLFDLKLAAGSCGYHLQNYYSDVDHDGFDLILDDGVNLRKIQLKSVGHDAKTAKWDINRGLLRPMANNLEALGFQLRALFSTMEGSVGERKGASFSSITKSTAAESRLPIDSPTSTSSPRYPWAYLSGPLPQSDARTSCEACCHRVNPTRNSK